MREGYEQKSDNLGKTISCTRLVKETHAHVLIGLLLLRLLLSGSSGGTRLTGSGSRARSSSRTRGTKGEQKLLEVLALNSLGENVGPDLNNVC